MSSKVAIGMLLIRRHLRCIWYFSMFISIAGCRTTNDRTVVLRNLEHWEVHDGKLLTVEGIAQWNYKDGSHLELELHQGPGAQFGVIFIPSLPRWPETALGKRVLVSGTLKHRFVEPLQPGEIRAIRAGHSFYLKDEVKWFMKAE